jgi:hypothetical protein
MQTKSDLIDEQGPPGRKQKRGDGRTRLGPVLCTASQALSSRVCEIAVSGTALGVACRSTRVGPSAAETRSRLLNRRYVRATIFGESHGHRPSVQLDLASQVSGSSLGHDAATIRPRRSGGHRLAILGCWAGEKAGNSANRLNDRLAAQFRQSRTAFHPAETSEVRHDQRLVAVAAVNVEALCRGRAHLSRPSSTDRPPLAEGSNSLDCGCDRAVLRESRPSADCRWRANRCPFAGRAVGPPGFDL